MKTQGNIGKLINSRMVCTQTRDHDHVRGDSKAGLLVLAWSCPCSKTEPIKYGINMPNKMKMMRDLFPSSSADTSGDAWWETGCRTVATYRKLPPCRQFAFEVLLMKMEEAHRNEESDANVVGLTDSQKREHAVSDDCPYRRRTTEYKNMLLAFHARQRSRKQSCRVCKSGGRYVHNVNQGPCQNLSRLTLAFMNRKR